MIVHHYHPDSAEARAFSEGYRGAIVMMNTLRRRDEEERRQTWDQGRRLLSAIVGGALIAFYLALILVN